MASSRDRRKAAGGSALDVGDLRVPKASDVLADRLRRQILDGELAPGVPLPPERVLAEESRLSRTVVREALRILEIEGLVSTRPGRNGGTVVRRPDVGSFARSLDVFIRGRRVRFHAILEAREKIEPICAELAAERRTQEDLEELDRVTAALERQIDDVQGFLTENVNWHVAVALMSHNELLGSFMQALSTAVRAATDIENFNSPEVRAAAVRAHTKIAEAIRAGDGKSAFRRMQRHVEAYRASVLSVPVPDEVDLERPQPPDAG